MAFALVGLTVASADGRARERAGLGRGKGERLVGFGVYPAGHAPAVQFVTARVWEEVKSDFNIHN